MPTSTHANPVDVLEEVTRLVTAPSTSDRFLAITCAAAIEDYTSLILSSKFKENNNIIANQAVDRINHISKLSLCYKFKLIHKDTFSDAEIIAKIRNILAHSLKFNSFKDKEISKHVKKLNLYKNVYTRGKIHYIDPDYNSLLNNKNDNRFIFRNSSLICISDLFNIISKI